MRSVIFKFLFLIIAAGCCGRQVSNELSPARFEKSIHNVYPALVRIEVITPEFADGREFRMQAGGSGVIISSDGYVITNHHVAGRATSIVCVLSNKEEIIAERIGTDAMTDICVLKLTEPREYLFVEFGDSDSLKVGDTVLAMGSPSSISQSVTAGVISNVEMIMPEWYGPVVLDGEDVGALVKWIMHDAAISPGNSGGPLIDVSGRIVGINELNVARGFGAAVPGNLAKSVVEEIIAKGELRRSWLGVTAQPLLKSSGRTEGILLGGVVAGSPADEAGLQPGDIILSYNGVSVSAKFREDMPLFNRLIYATPAGASIPVEVERDGKRLTLNLTSRLRGDARGRDYELKEWGMAVEDLTEFSMRVLKRKDCDGVLVLNTRPSGPCAEAKPSFQTADIIVAVAGKPVKNANELIALTAEITKDKTEPTPTIVAFERRNEQWLTIVKVGIRDLSDRSPEARKAYLPASYQVLTPDLAAALGLGGCSGMRLTDVFAGRSAEQAGLIVGDIITAIDGQPLHISRPEDAEVFAAKIREKRVGQEVTLSVIRGTESREVAVKLERSPKAIREMKRYQDIHLGFTARDLSDEDRRTMKIENETSGPIVADVEPGSLAAVANLLVADIVLSIDGKPTTDAASLKENMSEVQSRKPPRVVFFVKRGITTLFIEAQTPWQKSAEKQKEKSE